MFYCDECAKTEDWPADWYLPKSHGPCEVCGRIRTCTEGPSSFLRRRTLRPKDQA